MVMLQFKKTFGLPEDKKATADIVSNVVVDPSSWMFPRCFDCLLHCRQVGTTTFSAQRCLDGHFRYRHSDRLLW